MRRQYKDVRIELNTLVFNQLKPFAMFDIEAHQNVLAPEGWAKKTRFQPFMVGFGFWKNQSTFSIYQIYNDNEAEFVREVQNEINNYKTMYYLATKNFDVNVLEGRWVSFVKKFANPPFEPHVSFGDTKPINLRSTFKKEGIPRDIDRSSDSPEYWKDWSNGDTEPELHHNYLDILELGYMFAKLSNRNSHL
jgi:hypothetical protein